MNTPSATSLEDIARRGSALSRIKARIPTYLTDLKENPAWLPMFLLARLMPARMAHWAMTARPPAPFSAAPTLFDTVDRRQAVADLQRDGLSTGIDLPQGIVDEITTFAASHICYANFDRRLPFMANEHADAEQRFDRAILSGHYFDQILNCPAALAVQRDPLLQDIAAHYLGGEARIITTRLWWSFPTKGASEADKHQASLSKYHFDLDDWRMLKFFFYLTPVDASSGPHVYVKGSHRRRALRHQFTLFVGHPANDIHSVYGAEQSVMLCGQPGFGLVEDPFGFHMGTVAEAKPRLMMEIGFGVSPPSKRRYHGEPVVQ